MNVISLVLVDIYLFIVHYRKFYILDRRNYNIYVGNCLCDIGKAYAQKNKRLKGFMMTIEAITLAAALVTVALSIIYSSYEMLKE